MEFVEQAEDLARLDSGSYREQESFGNVRLVPDFTRGMQADRDFMETEAIPPDPKDFYPFLRPNTSEWEEFFSTRKVVQHPAQEGVPSTVVTSNIADALRSGLVRADSEKEEGEKSDKRGKKYEVVHLLTDPGLIQKFGFSKPLLAKMRNLAIVDTNKAAANMQERVRSFEGYEHSSVVVGRYARSWKWARDSVKHQAAAYPEMSVSVDARFVGKKIFVFSSSGNGDSVLGPEGSAAIVRLVHRMVEASSPQSVMYALGTELTILDIDIVVSEGCEPLSPSREGHAGSHKDLPLRSPSVVASYLSSEKRAQLGEASEACCTVNINGEDCATAVRITADYVLMNSHVMDEAGKKTVDGEVFSPVRMLSKDLWLVKARGASVSWHLRDIKPHEMVVLCYQRHGEMQWLGPVEVLSSGGANFSLSKDPGMLPGVSGAAVVAIGDLALLGVYDGTSLKTGIAAAFTQEMFTDICTLAEGDVRSHKSASVADGAIYKKMKDRGFGKTVDAVFSNTYAMYSGGSHVGMGFSHAKKLYTVCDPDVSPLAVGEHGQPSVYERHVSGLYTTEVHSGLISSHVPLPMVRSPSYGESIFIAGKDSEGDYCSAVGKVVHVGVSAKFFQVSEEDFSGSLPLQGGLVVAIQDAAVLGVYSGPGITRAGVAVGHCLAFPEEAEQEETRERPEAALQRLFPMLNVGLWPDGLARAALTHASDVTYTGETKQLGLAMIGDAAMRVHLFVRLQDLGKPISTWQTILQKDQSNAAQSAACAQLGLDKLLIMGRGASAQAGSKVYADLLEALAGVVYQHESASTFVLFCETVGLLKAEYG